MDRVSMCSHGEKDLDNLVLLVSVSRDLYCVLKFHIQVTLSKDEAIVLKSETSASKLSRPLFCSVAFHVRES